MVNAIDGVELRRLQLLELCEASPGRWAKTKRGRSRLAEHRKTSYGRGSRGRGARQRALIASIDRDVEQALDESTDDEEEARHWALDATRESVAANGEWDAYLATHIEEDVLCYVSERLSEEAEIVSKRHARRQIEIVKSMMDYERWARRIQRDPACLADQIREMQVDPETADVALDLGFIDLLVSQQMAPPVAA